MNRQDELAVGIVGAGWIGRYHAAAARQAPGVRLAAVADPIRAAAEEVASGAPVYDSPEAMAENEALDIAIICTPPATHLDLTCFFLDRRVHVLCEKPFAISLGEAVRMRDAAERAGLWLGLAAKYRYVPDVAQAKAWLDAGGIGEVISIETAFTARNVMAGRWQSKPEMSGGGVFIDNGSHAIDVINHLCGPITEVLLAPGPSHAGLAVEESAFALTKTASGVLGEIFVSWALPRIRDHYVAIHGTEGDIEVGWQASKYRTAGNESWEAYGTGYDITAALASQLANMAGAIRGTEALLVAADDGVRNVATVEAAYASVRSGGWQRVEVAVGASAK